MIPRSAIAWLLAPAVFAAAWGAGWAAGQVAAGRVPIPGVASVAHGPPPTAPPADEGASPQELDALAGGEAMSAPARFEPWDLYIESPTPVAAWQATIDLTSAEPEPGSRPVADDRREHPLVAGIESGESTAFADAPRYDPAALGGGIVVLADFSLAPAAELPRGRFRAATIHLEFCQGGAEVPLPEAVRLNVAADADGRPIPDATISLQRRALP